MLKCRRRASTISASQFSSYARQVRCVMRCVFGDPKKAPPPLERLSPEEAVSYVWKGDIVEELLHCMAPYMEDGMLNIQGLVYVLTIHLVLMMSTRRFTDLCYG
ncbi:hypothetical protein ACET3Z_000516 [Daucus carota]